MRNPCWNQNRSYPAFVRFPRIGQPVQHRHQTIQPGGTQDAFLLSKSSGERSVLWHPELTTRLTCRAASSPSHAFANTVTFIQQCLRNRRHIGQYATGSFGSALPFIINAIRCQEKLPPFHHPVTRLPELLRFITGGTNNRQPSREMCRQPACGVICPRMVPGICTSKSIGGGY